MVDNSSGGNNQDVELNLAPIIDCFTVLITYLLVTASFLTLTAMDVSISANSDSKDTPPPLDDKRPLVMTLDVETSNDILLKVSGGDLKKDYELKVIAKEGNWDTEGLEKNLTQIKDRWSELSEISVSAAPTIRYKELVSVINTAQKTLPKVYISGG